MGTTNIKNEVTVNNKDTKGVGTMGNTTKTQGNKLTTAQMMRKLTENGYRFPRPLTDTEIRTEYAKVADKIAKKEAEDVKTTVAKENKVKPDNSIVLTSKMVYQVAEELLRIRTSSFSDNAIHKNELYRVIAQKVFDRGGLVPEAKLMGAINFLVHNKILTFKIFPSGRIEFFKTFDDVVRDEYGDIIGLHMIPQDNKETSDK